MSRELTIEGFDRWLRAYGDAWEARDPDAAARLFTADARYHWTPFGDPKTGRAEIAAAWGQATARQHAVRFEHSIWFFDGRRGVAHWHTRFTRVATGRPVEIDGVLSTELDESGLCRVFREWWHSDEGA